MTENELTLSEYLSYYEIRQPVKDFVPIIERIKVSCSLLERMTCKGLSMPKSDLSLVLRVLRYKMWDFGKNREYIIGAIEIIREKCNTLYDNIVNNRTKSEAAAARLLILVLEENLEKIKRELSKLT